MKKILSFLAVAMLLAVIAPQTAYAEKKEKEKKEWKWEMPKKMTGIEKFDHYLRVCDTLNTRITTYMDSVTFYTVRPIDVQQADGTIIKRRCVVDDKDNIRGSNEALAQYFDMTNTGLAILGDLMKITGETTAATASLASDPLKALSYGKYLKAGPKIAIEGGKMMKELLKKMNQQKKEIRQYKKDYSEAGELKDPTISAEEIDAHYSNNEPIKMLSEEYNNAIAEIQAKDSSIQVPEDGDADIDGL
jgi:hypothetical protein